MTYDRIIRGGTVIDGCMTPAYQADIGIRDGRIAMIGRINGRAAEEIDARGRIVCPGFVDMHTHMDGQLFWDPMATPSSFHGVTTIMIANCGFALAPAATPEARNWATNMLSRVEGIPLPALLEGVKFEWDTYPQYLDALDRRPLGVNVGAMVPHSTIRYAVMGEDARKRAATPAEIEQLVGVFRAAMDAGGFGLSSTWNDGHADGDGVPVPSRFAKKDELLALACALSDYAVGGIEFTPKGLTQGVAPEDFALMGELSRAAGKPINWNALFDIFGKPGLWRQELDCMEAENAKGARIVALNSCFPIDADFCFATAGNLFDDREHWSFVLAQPLPERIRLMGDPEFREKLKADFRKPGGLFSDRWEDVTVVGVGKEENKKYLKRTITDIADERKVHPIDALLDLALSEDLKVEFFRRAVQNADEEIIAKILVHPLSIPGVSDGGAHLEYLCQYGWPVHLLAYWTRDKKVLTLEDAVRRCTSLPASILGLSDRGRIATGMPADLVVIDYANLALTDVEWLRDLPGGQKRKVHYAAGIDCVLVNGEVSLRDGKPTGALAGHLLRNGAKESSATPQAVRRVAAAAA